MSPTLREPEVLVKENEVEVGISEDLAQELFKGIGISAEELTEPQPSDAPETAGV